MKSEYLLSESRQRCWPGKQVGRCAAVVELGRKLARVCFAFLMNGTEFNQDFTFWGLRFNIRCGQ